MNFASDNSVGASPVVLQAIVAANEGTALPYGTDDLSQEAEAALAETFECELAAFLVGTGTAANALALGAVSPPGSAILCHLHSHVMNDECGAPEFFAGGAKLVGLSGDRGKITPATLQQALAALPQPSARVCPPAALSLSQATEAGTIYTPAELRALATIAQQAGLAVHMDGARFANALVALGCTPAELTWRAGVDVLSLGATKNGALACEAVIFFDPAKAKTFISQRKRGGHTWSKGRFLGAQMCAWLADGHWRLLAAHANAQAQRLFNGLADLPSVRLPIPREANEVFAIVPRETQATIVAAGAKFYEWDPTVLTSADAPHAHEVLVRFVTSFATRPEDVEQALALLAAAPADSAMKR